VVIRGDIITNAEIHLKRKREKSVVYKLCKQGLLVLEQLRCIRQEFESAASLLANYNPSDGLYALQERVAYTATLVARMQAMLHEPYPMAAVSREMFAPPLPSSVGLSIQVKGSKLQVSLELADKLLDFDFFSRKE